MRVLAFIAALVFLGMMPMLILIASLLWLFQLVTR